MKIKNLVEQQRVFFRSQATRDFGFRREQLLKLKSLLKANENEILQALKTDLHKSEAEAYASEFGFVLHEIDHALKNLKKWMRPKCVASTLLLWPSRSQIMSEPYGVTLVIAPWNYPLQLMLSPLVGAIAAGNCCILKPSEYAVATQNLVARIFKENFSEDHLAVVTGDYQVSEELLREKFDFIFFTGSTEVGRKVMLAAAQNLTPVCLELGGKSPCVIDATADLNLAARRVAWGKWYNAGQTCVAPDFLYVHESVYGEFVQKLKQMVRTFYGENPQTSSDYGRIISDRHASRLVQLIDSSKVTFGGQIDLAQRFIAPTILENLDWSQPVMQEEIFGPLLPIFRYKHIDEVASILLSRPKPLAFYLFTQSREVKSRFLNQISFGGGCINDCLVHLSHPGLPFGGVGESGIGAYHGQESFDVFSHRKAVVHKAGWLDIPLRYPPYTKWSKKMFQFFMEKLP